MFDVSDWGQWAEPFDDLHSTDWAEVSKTNKEQVEESGSFWAVH